MVDYLMVGNLEFKWHDMDDQPRLIEVVEVADVEGHVVVAEIADVLVHDHAVDLVVVIEIVDVPIVGVVVVLVPIVKALVESLALAASLKKGRKTAVPNQDKILE